MFSPFQSRMAPCASHEIFSWSVLELFSEINAQVIVHCLNEVLPGP
jgi:hypothetical protein